MSNMPLERMSSISEYEEHSNRTSITGLSFYTGYSQSPSSGSLSTIASTSTRSAYKPNGVSNGGKKSSDTSSTIMTQRIRGKAATAPKQNYEFCKKVRVSMALLGILFLVGAIFMLSFYLPKQYEDKVTDAEVIEEEIPVKPPWSEFITFSSSLNFLFAMNTTDITQNPSKIALKAEFGTLLTEGHKRNMTILKTNDSILMTFQDPELNIVSMNFSKSSTMDQCFEVSWTAPFNTKLEDCFDTLSSHWYGLGEVLNQKWPIDKSNFKPTAFLTTDFVDEYSPSVFGGILEPFVVNSKGAGLYVDEEVPLHISMNDNDMKRMCFRADPLKSYSSMYQRVFPNSTNILKYTICIDKDIKQVHKLMFNAFIEKPPHHPDIEAIRKPIWSTWVRFKELINQTSVSKMADEIIKYNFEHSHLQIEGLYSDYYGDFEFSRKRFDSVTNMIDTLKSQSFRVTVIVSPLALLKSNIFTKGLDLGYWITVGNRNVTGITRWWGGVGGVLDTTNDNAREWFIQRLKNFQKLKIDGFKFDAGETSYLPDNFRFSKKSITNPNYYTKSYVDIASHFDIAEVRVGYKTQAYPMYVRLLDRVSHWQAQNGLKSVLSAVLTLGILGYPYVIPDMVGGNSYFYESRKELYVRWAQLSAFLPCIQFSKAPWEFGVQSEEVLELVRDALKIRKSLLHIIEDAAINYNVTGDPIVRPLWWYWPEDHETFVADGEFMLGDSYLIAPVLYMNMVSHAIYLPAGVWEEQWREPKNQILSTGELFHYNVTLSDICYFKLIKEDLVTLGNNTLANSNNTSI